MKRTNLKKALSIVLALIFVVGIFAGCGNRSNSSDPSSSDAAKDTPDSSSSDAVKDTSDSDTTDQIKQRTLSLMIKNNANAFDFATRDRFPVWQEAEKLFTDKGLTLEFDIIESDQYDTTLTTALASASDLADVITISGLGAGDRINAINEGILIPFEDYLDIGDGTAKNFFEEYTSVANATVYTDGKMYWMPDYQYMTYKDEKTTKGAPHSLLVREDWLEKLNMEAPNSLEAFTAYLQACQDQDVNGNGVKDEYYVTQLRDFNVGVGQWFGLPRDSFGYNSATGEAVSTWQLPGVKPYFKYIQELLDKGLISPDYVASDSQTISTALANDQGAAYGSYACDTWSSPESLWRALLPVEVVDGIEPVVTNDPAELIGSRAHAFTKNLKDPEAAAIFLDICYSEEFYIYGWWGVEGHTYEVAADGSFVETELLKEQGGDFDKMAANAVTKGMYLWRQILPHYSTNAIENDLGLVEDNPAQHDPFITLFEEYEESYCTQPNSVMATPDAEEAATLSELESNFKTLSREIAVQIYKGEIDIDTEWDTKVIAELEAGGMNELLEVYQARMDRFFKK